MRMVRTITFLQTHVLSVQALGIWAIPIFNRTPLWMTINGVQGGGGGGGGGGGIGICPGGWSLKCLSHKVFFIYCPGGRGEGWGVSLHLLSSIRVYVK